MRNADDQQHTRDQHDDESSATVDRPDGQHEAAAAARADAADDRAAPPRGRRSTQRHTTDAG